MPVHEDRWWEARADSPSDAVAESLLDAVTQYGIPWLERRDTLESGLQALRENSELTSAAFCLALGRPDEAALWLERVRDHFVAMGMADVAERWLVWGSERGIVVA
jgi:hypothetical protein